MNRNYNQAAQAELNGHIDGLENSGKYFVGRKGNIRCRHVCVGAAGTNVPPLIVVRRRRRWMSGYGWAVAGLSWVCIRAVGCRLICMLSSLNFVYLVKLSTNNNLLLNVDVNYSQIRNLYVVNKVRKTMMPLLVL